MGTCAWQRDRQLVDCSSSSSSSGSAAHLRHKRLDQVEPCIPSGLPRVAGVALKAVGRGAIGPCGSRVGAVGVVVCRTCTQLSGFASKIFKKKKSTQAVTAHSTSREGAGGLTVSIYVISCRPRSQSGSSQSSRGRDAKIWRTDDDGDDAVLLGLCAGQYVLQRGAGVQREPACTQPWLQRPGGAGMQHAAPEAHPQSATVIRRWGKSAAEAPARAASCSAQRALSSARQRAVLVGCACQLALEQVTQGRQHRMRLTSIVEGLEAEHAAHCRAITHRVCSRCKSGQHALRAADSGWKRGDVQ